MSEMTRRLLTETDVPARMRRWLQSARRQNWSGIDQVIEATISVHGEIGHGLWLCDVCHGATMDVALGLGCSESEATLLMGDITLCHRCATTHRGDGARENGRAALRQYEHEYVREITSDRAERAAMHAQIDEVTP